MRHYSSARSIIESYLEIDESGIAIASLSITMIISNFLKNIFTASLEFIPQFAERKATMVSVHPKIDLIRSTSWGRAVDA
jgi:hypothetical protein